MMRVQREKIQSEQKEEKKFEGESGAEESQTGQWRYTSWRSPRRKSQCW